EDLKTTSCFLDDHDIRHGPRKMANLETELPVIGDLPPVLVLDEVDDEVVFGLVCCDGKTLTIFEEKGNVGRFIVSVEVGGDVVEGFDKMIETTKEGTKILTIVDGKLRTVSESSIMINLKLNDETRISSLPDAELFENLTLMGYNISPNQKFTFQKGQFSHQWKYLIHTIMQCLSSKSIGFNEFSSNIATSLVCLATNRVFNFSKMIFDGMVRNVNNKVSKFLMYPRFLSKCLKMGQFGQITHTHTFVVPFHTRKIFTTLRVNSPSFSGRTVPLFPSMLVTMGEGSGTPTEPHHTPTPEATPSPQHELSSSSLLPAITEPLPTVIPSDNPPLKQSLVLPPVVDEPASPLRDDSQGEACPTDSGLVADQDRENIAKTSTLPSDSTPRVPSLAADEGTFCDYHNMIAILEKYEHNTDFHQIVDFVEASYLRIKTTDEGTKILATVDGKLRTIFESSIRRNLKLRDEAGISSLPDAELFKNLTLMGVYEASYPSFSGKTVPLFPSMLVTMGEGSGTPTEPHHTPTPEATPSPLHELSSSSSLPPVTTEPLPTVIPSDTSPLKQYTKRTRIAQSLVLPPVADEPTSLLGDDSQGEACPTISGFKADRDRANITKTSTLPCDSTPRVTSLAADEGSMQHKLTELTDLCTRLQRQQAEMASKITAQDLEISQLKARGRSLDEEKEATIERSTEKGINDTEEMVNVLTSLDAATVLSSGVFVSISPVAEVPTGSGSIPTASPPGTGVPTSGVPTGSDVVPTASPIFTTATVATPYTRRKCKEKMIESETPKKKKIQEQMDVQMARQLEEEMERYAQIMNEQIARDAEIARNHAEEELQIMIDGLDMNNETVAKYLQEYYQFARDLPIGERIELISNLVKYQDYYAKVLKYQIQQRKPLSRKQHRDFYMSVSRSHSGWKAKHFKGMTLEEIKEKFDPVWKQIQDFIPIGSKEQSKIFKRKMIRLEQDSAKKALQVKHPIIDWEVHTEGQRSYWTIIRLRGSTTSYQFFVDLLKHFDREDLNQLWALMKETLNIRQAANDKEKELWVELKRLYEPDVKDLLWTHTQNMMHNPVEWRLYDSCGVHHVLSKDQEIFMLVEKEYPLRKGLAIAMIINKLQVEKYSQMANDLIKKIYKIANSLSQRSD
nr:hypothetical protein [Tanacetum cinerariifolium]